MSETPSEREERLTHQEERLQKAHQRRMEQEPSGSSGGGGGIGKIGLFLSEHKTGVIIGIAAAVVLFIFIKNQQSSSANQSPNFAGGTQSGALPSDLQTALDQLTQQYNTIETQLGNLQTGSGNGSGSGSNGGGSGSGSGGGSGGGSGSGGSGGGGNGGSSGGGSTPVANAPFNSEPSLLPSGWTIQKGTIPGSTNNWYAFSNDNQHAINLSQLFPGIQVTYGSGGRVWYQLPGWANQQALTGPGETGGFLSTLTNGSWNNNGTPNPPAGSSNFNGGTNYSASNPNVKNSNITH